MVIYGFLNEFKALPLIVLNGKQLSNNPVYFSMNESYIALVSGAFLVLVQSIFASFDLKSCIRISLISPTIIWCLPFSEWWSVAIAEYIGKWSDRSLIIKPFLDSTLVLFVNILSMCCWMSCYAGRLGYQ